MNSEENNNDYVNKETLYPDLGEKYSAEEREFLAQISKVEPPKMSDVQMQPPQQFVNP